jgi:hypothetical protein
MELTDFLLARIGEDEEFVRTMTRVGERRAATASPTDTVDMMSMTHFLLDDPEVKSLIERVESSRVQVPTSVARVLADCEVKRRIVTDDAYTGGPYDAAAVNGYFDGHEHVLRLLAMPYADHPDYDPTWAA